MLRAPFDDRLWSLLSTQPAKVNKKFIEIINENLTHRRSRRLQPCGRSGTDENPQLCVPPLGNWSGDYQDLPSVANMAYKVQYQIVFKSDGAVEGSGSSTEGNFTIKGVYNLRTGFVAWRQASASCPVWHNPCSKYGAMLESEFFGSVSNFAGPGPARLTGTFLTDLGRYCAVNLLCPRDNEAKTGEVVALPTLLTARLTGKWAPIIDDKLEGKPSLREKRRLQRQQTNGSDTVFRTYDSDEEEEETPKSSPYI